MHFGLCNAFTIFQRYILSIFSVIIENCLKVFINNLIVFRNSFRTYLDNLEKVLERRKEKILVLNWEKCHFMTIFGIVLSHVVSL